MRSRHPATAPSLLFAAAFVALVPVIAQTVPVIAQTVPPTAATSTATPPAPSTPAAATPGAHPGHRAEVSFAGGLLTVNANNSSLNQVIREIARQTGMKVTGSVMEDRVFGSYGPADPSRVLATLLDGTGSNLLIVQNAADQPKELVLTQRLGAATPPNPNAALEAAADSGDPDDEPPVPSPRRGFPGQPGLRNDLPVAAPRRPAQDVGGVSRDPAAIVPSTTDQTVTFPQIDANTPSSTGTSTPLDQQDETESPARTPQEIFQELQRLQTQKPQ